MTVINETALRERLDDEGQAVVKQILENPEIQVEIERCFEDKTIQKISKGPKTKFALKHGVIFLDVNAERQAFVIGKDIKKGGKAVLKNAYNLSTGEHVALKIVRGITAEGEDEVAAREREKQEYKRERELLKIFDRFKGKIKRGGKRYLAQDFIAGSDLDQFNREMEDIISRADIRREAPQLYKEIVDTMAMFLVEVTKFHEEGFIHRDIKPGNAMLIKDEATGEMKCMLIDFGSSDRNESKLFDKEVGSLHYFAPEIQSSSEQQVLFTQKSDMFAVGKTMKELFSLLEEGKMRIADVRNFKGVKERLETLFNEMLVEDPNKRISASEALDKLKEILSSKDELKFLCEKIESAQLSRAPTLEV